MNTPEGGKTLRTTMIKKYGSEEAWKQVMRDRGAIGGKLGHDGGFGQGEKGRELARRAGYLGGIKSRRRKVKD